MRMDPRNNCLLHLSDACLRRATMKRRLALVGRRHAEWVLCVRSLYSAECSVTELALKTNMFWSGIQSKPILFLPLYCPDKVLFCKHRRVCEWQLVFIAVESGAS
jgi:hypothetical protein